MSASKRGKWNTSLPVDPPAELTARVKLEASEILRQKRARLEAPSRDGVSRRFWIRVFAMGTAAAGLALVLIGRKQQLLTEDTPTVAQVPTQSEAQTPNDPLILADQKVIARLELAEIVDVLEKWEVT